MDTRGITKSTFGIEVERMKGNKWWWRTVCNNNGKGTGTCHDGYSNLRHTIYMARKLHWNNKYFDHTFATDSGNPRGLNMPVVYVVEMQKMEGSKKKVKVVVKTIR